MNKGILLGRKGETWEVLSLPHDGTMRDQMRNFQSSCKDTSVKAKFDEIQLWSESSGRLKRRVFNATDGNRVKTAAELNQLDGKPEVVVNVEVETKTETAQVESEPKAPVESKPSKRESKAQKAKAAKAAKAAALEAPVEETSKSEETGQAESSDLLS